MERNCWADVPGNAIEAVPDLVFSAVAGFDNEMFLAVRNRTGIFQVE